jgi:hypothetical protein
MRPHRDANAHSCSDSYRNPNATPGAHSYTHSYTYGDANGDPGPHPDSYAHTEAG